MLHSQQTLTNMVCLFFSLSDCSFFLSFSVDSLIHSTQFQSVEQRNLNGFFVTEAKQQGLGIAGQVPQAVAALYASAKYLKYGLVFCS